MGQWIVIWLGMEYPKQQKEKNTVTHHNMDESRRHEKWKKSDTKEYNCVIPLIWNSEES